MGANVVRAIMIDRFSLDGRLVDIETQSDLSSLFPVKARFIPRVMGGSDHKGVLVKGHLASTMGVAHHRFDGEWPAAERLQISHYKWISGAIDRMRTSVRQLQAARLAWTPQYEKALHHYDQYGRFAWETFGGARASDFILESLPHCSACGGAIDEAEAEYSMAYFGQPLCRGHQKRYRGRSK
jgi:hypothetical protein